MKKLIIGAAVAALGLSSAITSASAFGPSPSDADPPGALFSSRPGGVDHVPEAVQEMSPGWSYRDAAPGWSNSNVHLRTSNVRLRHHQHRHSLRGNAPGPQTGTAKDSASAPSR